MRLFIAINFDKQTVDMITAVQSRLKNCTHGKFTYPENIHLTLAFLGEVPESDLGKAKKAMEHISIPKTKLVFSKIDNFKRDNGIIWWIGIEENDSLLNMQKELIAQLIRVGFHIDCSAFIPHITLAHRVNPHKHIDKNYLMSTTFSAEVCTISLMLSGRIDGRLAYSELYRVEA